jgi:hypothetical protein
MTCETFRKVISVSVIFKKYTSLVCDKKMPRSWRVI